MQYDFVVSTINIMAYTLIPSNNVATGQDIHYRAT